jgi:hypothetical protein
VIEKVNSWPLKKDLNECFKNQLNSTVGRMNLSGVRYWLVDSSLFIFRKCFLWK